MGRKKGKQSGGFSRKALHTAYVTEVNTYVSEARKTQPRRQAYSHLASHDSSPRNVQCQSVQRICNSTTVEQIRRPVPIINQLQGLLLERRWEDRVEDRDWRRRQARNNSTGATKATDLVSMQIPDENLNPPGWIHFYKNAEEIKMDRVSSYAKLKQRRQLEKHITDAQTTLENIIINKNIPSLKYLCTKTLAPALPHYIRAWGGDTVHAILATLPAQILTLLSTLTVCTDGDMVRVIGKHSHLDRLSLCFFRSNGNKKGPPTMDDMSSAAVLDLVPRFRHRNQEGAAYVPSQDLAWEDMDDMQHGSWEGCVLLKRLEIRDAPKLSSCALSTLLEKCAGITHLSLCHSFNSYHGIEILLDPVTGILGKNIMFWKHGEVLDLSYCDWLTESMLLEFLVTLLARCNAEHCTNTTDEVKYSPWGEHDVESTAMVLEHSHKHDEAIKLWTASSPLSLRLIRILGCTGINVEKCNLLCVKMFGRSLLNTDAFDPYSEF